MSDLTRRALLGSTAALAVTALAPASRTNGWQEFPGLAYEETGGLRRVKLVGMDLASGPDSTGLAEWRSSLGPSKLMRLWRDGKLVYDAPGYA